MTYTFWYDYMNDEETLIDCRKVVQADSLEEAVFNLIEDIEGVNFRFNTVNHIPWDQIQLDNKKYQGLIRKKYQM